METTSEPQWSAIKALCAAPYLPATTARRTIHLSLWSAFGVHLLAVAATLVLLDFLDWQANRRHPFWLLREMIEEVMERPLEATLIGLAVALAVEAALLLLALLVMPWGARDEPLGDSYRAALRQTWLHCGHALLPVLIVGLTVITYESSWRQYPRGPSVQFDFNQQRPMPPVRPSGAPPGSQVQRDYEIAFARHAQAMIAWQDALARAWQEHRRQQPFWVRYGPGVIFSSSLLFAGWILWSLLRAVATDRAIALQARPPACEKCGYNLTGMPVEGRCPECGQSVQLSLLSEVRQGTAWERARGVRRVPAYLRTAYQALLAPGTTGRQMDVLAFRRDHGILLGINIVVILILGAACVAAAVYSAPIGLRLATLSEALIGAPMVAGIEVFMMLGLIVLCTAAMTVEFYLRDRRNLGHATIRVASHQSFLFVPWVLFAATQLLLFRRLDGAGVFARWRSYGVDPDLAQVLLMIAMNAPFAAWYYLSVRRGVLAARFANR